MTSVDGPSPCRGRSMDDRPRDVQGHDELGVAGHHGPHDVLQTPKTKSPSTHRRLWWADGPWLDERQFNHLRSLTMPPFGSKFRLILDRSEFEELLLKRQVPVAQWPSGEQSANCFAGEKPLRGPF